MNILYLANELRYTCGVTNHLLYLTSGLAANSENRIFIITGGGDGIERFKNINAEILNDNRFHHQNRSAVHYISAINVLSGFIKKNKIDIIHSHTHYAANIASNASYLKRMPKIQTNHGLLTDKGKLKHFNADKYIAINEHIYDYLLANNITSEDNIKLIRCGIYVPPEAPVKSKVKLKIIAASRFTKEKGLDIFINAVSKLGNEVKQKAEFIIAGMGEEETALKQMNSELNAGISFPGNIVNLGEILKNTHIFVYPSRSKSEGFPAVITEAGASGNLLITSDFYGVTRAVENNVDGIIFKSEDADNLAEALSRAINDFDSLAGFRLNFYNKVKNLFNLETMIQKHEDLYKECLRT